MRFELDLAPPPTGRLYISAFTIGTSYFLGGLLPLIPYFFTRTTMEGLIWSCILTGVVLILFGICKSFMVNRIEGWRGAVKSGLWTLIVGGLAAGGAFVVVRLLDVKQD
jgi:vacuolar iron transporter family protein